MAENETSLSEACNLVLIANATGNERIQVDAINKLLDASRQAATELEALRKRCEAVEAALKLARNRLQRLALECPHGSAIRNDACEWAGEATAAIAAAQEPSHG